LTLCSRETAGMTQMLSHKGIEFGLELVQNPSCCTQNLCCCFDSVNVNHALQIGC